jgi:formylglycine-generating enzyme
VTVKSIRLAAAAVILAAASVACTPHAIRAADTSTPTPAPAGPLKPGEKPEPSKPYVDALPTTGQGTVTFTMIPIPAGAFQMGSPDSEPNRKADEGPQHEVKVDAFWMGECEVTQAEYTEFLSQYQRLAAAAPPRIPADKVADAVTYPTPMYELEAGPKLDRMGRGGKYPAVIMSQLAARQYTKWLSKKTGRFYRLPTEAEWEYACRAGTTTAYSFGNDPDKLADYGWFVDNSKLKDGDNGYHPVRQKKPNPWGLYDMHGNVGEWVIDAYSADWYKQFAGKTSNWHDTINWPSKEYPRLIRGGGWDSDPEDCRSAARYQATAKLNLSDPQLPQSPHWISEGFWVGFRIMSPVAEPSDAEKHKYWDADDDYTKKVLERDRELRDIPTLGK